MTTIVTRASYGAPLPNTTVDQNFTNLNTDKLEFGQAQSSGTTNGVPYLNASKVLTSGSALTFDGTNLGVGAGGVSAGLLRVWSGSNDKRIQLSNDGTVSIINSTYGSSGAAPLVFQISDIEQMRLTSTGLGIGTSSPGVKLEVVGETYIRGATNKASLSFLGASAATDGAFSISSQATRSLVVRDEYLGAERLRLDASGNLGLGVTQSGWGSGVKAFEVNAQGSALLSAGGGGIELVSNGYFNGTSWIYASSPSRAAAHYYQTSGAHIWRTAPSGTAGAAISFTQAMTLDASGQLLIGTTSTLAGSNLTVGSGSGATGAVQYLNGGSYGGTLIGRLNGANTWLIGDTTSALGSGTGFINYVYGANPWLVYTNSAERARIDASGNFGIGTTSPQYKLHLSGSSPTAMVQDTGANASQAFIQATNSGNYFGCSTSGGTVQPMIFYVGVERMRLDASGNLGLGVTPSAWTLRALQIGYGGWLGTTAAADMRANAYYDGANKYIGNGYGLLYQQNIGTGTHSWHTAPSGTAGNPISFTQAMTLDASGNLGLGTTSPTGISGYTALKINNASSGAILDLAQGDTMRGRLVAVSGSFTLETSGTIPILFSPSGTERARIDASGNLGLGVTPSGWYSTRKAFQVGSTAAMIADSGGVEIRQNALLNASGSEVYLASNYASIYAQGSGQHRWYTAPSGTAGNAISFTQAMTLDASGNLMGGITSAAAANANGWYIAPGAGYGGNMAIMHASGAASGNRYASFLYNAAEIGSISQNGTTGVLYNQTSDYRLKNNPEPVTGYKEFILGLQPKKWQWADGSGEGVGFIAHEFAEVAKHSVSGEKDAVDADGNPIYQSMQSSSPEVMANLIALVQEQQQIITELRAEFDAYKAAHP